MKAMEKRIAELEPLQAMALAEDTLRQLAACAREISFDAESYVFREGERADRFYVIEAGRVALELQGNAPAPMLIQTLAKNDLLGWSWLVEPRRWSFDARCLEHCRMLAFDGDKIRQLCDHDEHFGHQLFRTLTALIAGRLQATRRQLTELYGVQI